MSNAALHVIEKMSAGKGLKKKKKRKREEEEKGKEASIALLAFHSLMYMFV